MPNAGAAVDSVVQQYCLAHAHTAGLKVDVTETARRLELADAVDSKGVRGSADDGLPREREFSLRQSQDRRLGSLTPWFHLIIRSFRGVTDRGACDPVVVRMDTKPAG
ncbi:hypothetical protein CF165_49280 [Amycolatopsis vastitatis]|uniref:Uncharacterized protein n=1 Tax=Amycolatopsis vastitatis TaxID=1905142 RepID=A0A229SJX6_9PSEU|nr:hypothetical protein CF165_49280 [Amycolatopsis vastitatis]